MLLLIINEEENSFWMLVAFIEDVLPPGYFTSNMIGVNTDIHVTNIYYFFFYLY